MAEKEIVIYERGKEVAQKRIPPELLQIIMLDDLRVAIGKVNEHLEKEEFEGVLVPRTLSATDKVKHIAPIHTWPYLPWINAFFTNRGPATVKIAINEPSERFELRLDETITVDRTHADERINVIYYVCDKDETASVRVIGEY